MPVSQWINENPKKTILFVVLAIILTLVVAAVVVYLFVPQSFVASHVQKVFSNRGVTGPYFSPVGGVCPLPGSLIAQHSDFISENDAARLGANQQFLNRHPLEQQAREKHAGLYNNPHIPCFEPASTCYDPAQSLLQETDAQVPAYQRALKNLPAMHQMNFQQQFPANNIGPHTRQGIDTMASLSLDSGVKGEDETFQARVDQTAGSTDGMAGIYGRADTRGISMINQKSRMTDPTKMLPRADPSQEANRMVQAGPSIEEIGSRVPKAADILKMMKSSSSVLSHTIPRDKPPLYTEGLNAFRQTRLPSRTVQGDCLFGISPLEISDVIDYYPNPFATQSTNVPFTYTVPGSSSVDNK